MLTTETKTSRSTVNRDPVYQPTRGTMLLGPRLYSHALRALHDAAADASPVLPEFESFDIASGRRGHPDAMAIGDMLDRHAVVMAGEIGKSCRMTVVEPACVRELHDHDL